MIGKQQAVDQKPQLSVGKLPDKIKIRQNTAFLTLTGFRIRNHSYILAVLNLVPEINQIHQITLDGFPISNHIVFRL